MKAILFCPGPSLARHPLNGDEALGRPRATRQDLAADLVVAVNRAALLVPCDCWAALDPPMVERHHRGVIGSPTLLTTSDTPRIIARNNLVWRGGVVRNQELLDYLPHALNYVLYSATTGLVYAAWKGATSIDVFGADWSGTLDYDGAAAGTNRTEQRWTSEQQIWAATVGALAALGVEVTRHVL